MGTTRHTLTLNKTNNIEADSLPEYIGRRFIKRKNGVKTCVELVKIKRNGVVVREPGRADSFTVPKVTFLKEYTVTKEGE